MSRARKLRFGKAARNSRARANLSCGATAPGTNTISRHTIASLFRLRRCVCAERFKLSYTASGMFFKVSVVAMSNSNRNGTIMVSLGAWVKPGKTWARANPPLHRTACGAC